jgi:hypothetical protein
MHLRLSLFFIALFILNNFAEAELFRRRRSSSPPNYVMGQYPQPNYPIVMMPNTMPNTTSSGSSESPCRFGDGGSNTNQLQCSDGIYYLGSDGIYRKSQQNLSGNSTSNTMPNTMPGTSNNAPKPNPEGRDICVYGNDGQDTNTLICPDGIFSRGADGIFRPAKQAPQYSKTNPDHTKMPSGVRKMPPLETGGNQNVHNQNQTPEQQQRITSSGVNKMPEKPGDTLRSSMNKCAVCHLAEGVLNSGISSSYKDPEKLKNHLPIMKDGTLNDMIGRANLSHEESQSIKEYIQTERRQNQILKNFENNPVDPCYTTNEERARIIAGMPKVNKEGSPIAEYLLKAQDTGRMVFYDKANVPKTWQSSNMISANSGIQSYARFETPTGVHTNASMYERMGYHSDGAREFPWAHSAGSDISPNATSEKFFIPPTGGSVAQIVNRTRGTDPTYFGTSTNVNGPQIGWNYEPGTMFGESLKSDGITFEIRLRKKMQDGQWQMDVLRPFENPQELAAALKKLCDQVNPPEGCKKVSAETINKIANPQPKKISRTDYINRDTFATRRDPLTLSKTAIESTQEETFMQELPELPKDVVKTLLTTTPFKSVFGKPWIKGPPPAWAPTSRYDFNIVPKYYFGAFVPMTQQACMKCHEAAGKQVDNFDPPTNVMFAPAPDDQPRARTWYNFIPGNDGILSFHPFDKDAVKRNAYINSNTINSCLTKSKLFR